MMTEVKREEKATCKYLIIGGAPKSATTSLFYYLADHPQVCPANRKETYFFARDFDLANICTIDETAEAFESYFTHCDALNRLRLEATPYTLYAEGAANKIRALLPNSTVLFVLRDPVERLISDYYFQFQRGNPSVQGTFDEFIEWQQWMRGKVPGLVEQGCYIKYLRSFFSVFEKKGVPVIFFEELIRDPVAELREMCVRMDIVAEYFTSYNFHSRNRTMRPRYEWLNRIARTNVEPLVSNIRTRLLHRPKMYKVFEDVIKTSQSTYRAINDSEPVGREPIADEKLADLVSYYRPYSQALAKELGRQLPWKSLQ